MQLTRNQFFAAFFAPLLAALGVKPAVKTYRTTAGLNNFLLWQHRAKMEHAFMFGFRTSTIKTPYGSFVMVDNAVLRNHATDT